MGNARIARPTGPGVRRAPVLVVMGVSGSGKSTVAGIIARETGWDLQEGDALHSRANLEKMSSARPLTDEDRWPWLALVAAWITEHTENGRPGVITCSALKRSYRDVLRRDNVVFVHLAGTTAQLGERLSARRGHHMPASLLDSQLATLEPIESDENAIVVDVDGSPTEIASEIMAMLP